MTRDYPIPVRLDEELRDRIRRVAGELGLPVSTLMRMAVKLFVDRFEEQGEEFLRLVEKGSRTSVRKGAQGASRPQRAAVSKRIAAEEREKYPKTRRRPGGR